MRKYTALLGAVALAGIVLAGATLGEDDKKKEDVLLGWTHDFLAEKPDLVSSGWNPYFVLEPGYVLQLEDGDEKLVITVLAETKTVDGVETRVVEERQSKKGVMEEVARNYFAMSKRTNSVFYFGEDVDEYKDGKIASHEGSWVAGVSGAKFGLMMPGVPLVHARYYQEQAPKVAMDRAEIVSVTDSLKTPAGAFTQVLKTLETTPLEPLVRETKYYAPGVGLIQDGSLKLTKYGGKS